MISSLDTAGVDLSSSPYTEKGCANTQLDCSSRLISAPLQSLERRQRVYVRGHLFYQVSGVPTPCTISSAEESVHL
jgi:hypothetical protein